MRYAPSYHSCDFYHHNVFRWFPCALPTCPACGFTASGSSLPRFAEEGVRFVLELFHLHTLDELARSELLLLFKWWLCDLGYALRQNALGVPWIFSGSMVCERYPIQSIGNIWQGTTPAVWRKMREVEKSWKPRKFAVLMTERDEVILL